MEQLIKEMIGSAPDLFDFLATVSVLLYKKMEVRYFQCVWYMVTRWIPNAGSWTLSKKSLLSIILATEHYNRKASIILVTTSNI